MSMIKMLPYGCSLALAAIWLTRISGWVVYKLRAVRMAPLGPNLYSLITYASIVIYFLVVMGFAYVNKWQVGDTLDSRVQVYAMDILKCLAEFLRYYKQYIDEGSFASARHPNSN